ncbi:dihydrolipoyl dehydrogenase [Pelagibacteraceae bacterium]|jgi:dihydrolipoamide dehydrogenase|nr:dihydrolipoyl dehydrogenase [Pelagibacteraceae bacterium]MDC0339516.1 dihydrolipoyl dehydrogenase [Pelagibacteraceae bacterium]MDC0366116.1 dihydrolipoyl dehydrogenase [Pelagibacteraceae bacterium]MDC3233274.1 dihydrolipoyl dehydrogenase [Pelagibacteraceae bacterium]|tara:strand:+ start:2773 stop:4182 length:1410 start_codon:yes stop_codon:yes gene_type:complete
MVENNFDVIVIGGGPGGYVCAIRAAQLGLKTACVESRGSLGGTCLNVGCIPSKSLLNLSENYKKAKKDFNDQGIEISDIKLNINKMMSNKDKSVQVLTKGIEFLFKKNKVTYFKGKGVIFSENSVVVYESDNKRSNIKTKNIVIATGSSPTSLPGIEIDEKNIVSSTGALSFSEVPKDLIVIGGGYIGLEMGSVWSRLGSNVTVVEYLDFITPGMDREVSNEFKKILTKQGIKFKLNNKVTAATNIKNKVIVDYTNNTTAVREKVECDKVLISVGRKPYTDGLNLSKIGIKKDSKGRIEVNEKLQTSLKNIYAIGDVIKGPMLAHKAEDEGIAVAEIIAGQAGHVNYDVIPSVVYTSPEVASVGKTEEQLKSEKRDYKVGKFPFLANSRAKVNNQTEGFVKMLADSNTDKVLGVHIIGPHCGDMIAEMALAMEFGASAEDIARTCHAHPTHTEAIKEAALAVDKRPIHF